MRRPGDDYGDLAELVLAGGVAGDNAAAYGPGELRERYTVRLGPWEAMIGELLGQISAHAGSLAAGLDALAVPEQLREAWTGGDVLAAMDASATWLAPGQRRRTPRLVLAPSVLAHRGDSYRDMRDAGAALAGDGALDPARLRRRYTVERAPWLRMVGDLLGQVLADAGSVERASTVLGVTLPRLTRWVRRFVSRGSKDAARSRWPVAPAADAPTLAVYDDLVEAVERGMIDGDNATEIPGVRGSYTIELDSWARMTGELLGQIVADAGSVRRAAQVIDVPRSTLGQWVKQRRKRGELGS
jgi:hypothetical protein